MSDTPNLTFEEALSASLHLAHRAAEERKAAEAKAAAAKVLADAEDTRLMPRRASAAAKKIVEQLPARIGQEVDSRKAGNFPHDITLYEVESNWREYDEAVAQEIVKQCAAVKVPVRFEKEPAYGRDMCDNLCTGTAGRVWYVLP